MRARGISTLSPPEEGRRDAHEHRAASHDDGQITAMTIAIEDAERRCAAALRDLARLLEGGTIDLSQAAGASHNTMPPWLALNAIIKR